MKRIEKRALVKFFFMYFGSVALLVVVAGYFYFNQTRDHLLKMEEFSLIEYARHLKMGGPDSEFSGTFTHSFIPARGRHIDIRNFEIDENSFCKDIPLRIGERYLRVCKSDAEYRQRIYSLIEKIVTIQALLLILFALLSYSLATSAIRPLRESVDLLESFVKDLIHDLNTPITAIKLNLTVLETIEGCSQIRAIKRLEESAETISHLHENLTVLLERKTFQSVEIDICGDIRELVEQYRMLYPDIEYSVECRSLEAYVHRGAFRQMMQNLLGNASSYNRRGGYVKIYTKGRSVYIEDSGMGIEEPERVFERDYSTGGSSGLGLDIVKRLAMAMQIKIEIESVEGEGSTFILTMP